MSVQLDFVKRHALFWGMALGNFLSHDCIATGPDGIIGGQGNAPYAAFLEPDGSIANLQGLPPTGLTFRVAMNHSGEGLIGGTNGVNAYAAFVAPDRSLTPLMGLMAPGEIYTVAINPSGMGIIGGGNFILNIPYAAFATPSGSVSPFSGLPPSGLIYSVALDASGEGIIGGIGPSSSAYAAVISPNGALTPITGLPATGAIYWVAINGSGKKLIGGQSGSSNYAAFLSLDEDLIPIAGLPSGQVFSVAINDMGAGIIGGTSLNLPFAALVDPNGSVTTLMGLPSTPGILYNVAINSSGTGLIAGFSASGPFGAFVSPDGCLTPLIGLPVGNGFLDGISIHSSGIGLVGGEFLGAPFAALAAPNGKLTYLSGLPTNGQINSTAIAALDGLVPDSIGPFDSWANTQLAFADALTQHSMIHHKNSSQNWVEQDGQICCDETRKKENSSLWFAPFGNFVYEKKRHEIPKFSNEIAGALLGYDYNGIQDVTIGGGLAYAFNYVHYAKKLGHAAINQESAVAYASLNKPHFYMNVALWGGLFQTSNKRRSILSITSKAHPWGWNLSPHLELSTPFSIAQCHKYVIDPFVTLDWVNNWQYHYREQGSSGFNIVLHKQYASILRSEIGIRFYETLQYAWGRLVFEEKVSYANRTRIHKGSGTAYFIGAFSTFEVETLNSSAQNLGIGQIHIECIPLNLKDFYGSIDYQGEFGTSLQSHMLTLTIGKDF